MDAMFRSRRSYVLLDAHFLQDLRVPRVVLYGRFCWPRGYRGDVRNECEILIGIGGEINALVRNFGETLGHVSLFTSVLEVLITNLSSKKRLTNCGGRI